MTRPDAPPAGDDPARRRRRAGLVAGPLLFTAASLVPLPGAGAEMQQMLAVAALMATWWVSEAIPLAATSLVPVVAFRCCVSPRPGRRPLPTRAT